MPASRSALIQSRDGTPKWKLTTFGLAASRVASMASSSRKLV